MKRGFVLGAIVMLAVQGLALAQSNRPTRIKATQNPRAAQNSPSGPTRVTAQPAQRPSSNRAPGLANAPRNPSKPLRGPGKGGVQAGGVGGTVGAAAAFWVVGTLLQEGYDAMKQDAAKREEAEKTANSGGNDTVGPEEYYRNRKK